MRQWAPAVLPSTCSQKWCGLVQWERGFLRFFKPLGHEKLIVRKLSQQVALIQWLLSVSLFTQWAHIYPLTSSRVSVKVSSSGGDYFSIRTSFWISASSSSVPCVRKNTETLKVNIGRRLFSVVFILWLVILQFLFCYNQMLADWVYSDFGVKKNLRKTKHTTVSDKSAGKLPTREVHHTLCVDSHLSVSNNVLFNLVYWECWTQMSRNLLRVSDQWGHMLLEECTTLKWITQQVVHSENTHIASCRRIQAFTDGGPPGCFKMSCTVPCGVPSAFSPGVKLLFLQAENIWQYLSPKTGVYV